MAVRLTVLNSMAGRDLPQALDRHVEWGLRELDLKDGLFGRKVEDLTPEEAAPEAFRTTHLACLDRVIETAIGNEVRASAPGRGVS